MVEKEAFKCFIAIFILAFLLTLTHEALAYTSSDNAAQPDVLITEIYSNTATKNEPEEYVAITNPYRRLEHKG